jgi:hypothetical protein
VAGINPRRKTPAFPAAACRGRGDADWFPEGGIYRAEHLLAFAICGACPEADVCREFGSLEADGIWGGIDFGLRSSKRRYRRQLRQQVPVAAAPVRSS